MHSSYIKNDKTNKIKRRHITTIDNKSFIIFEKKVESLNFIVIKKFPQNTFQMNNIVYEFF